MFIQRLKQKLGNDKGNERWQDRPNINKGMTWQAQRQVLMVESDKQAQTKIQFENKKNFKETQQDFVQFSKKSQKQKKLNAISSNSQKTTNTLNTFDTFKSYDQTDKFKPSKKVTDQSQGTSFISYQLQKLSQIQQQRKIPMKPNPVKKKHQTQTKQQSNPLVIQSKQYMNKNNLEQIKEEKQKSKIKTLKISKEKQQQEIKKEKTPNQPFSIKKSGSKKQHNLDYKATQYISKDQLAPVQNTKQTLKYIITNLPKDNDWNKQFDSLDGLRRLMKNHYQFYPTIIQNIQGIMPQVLKLVQSLRSSVAKNAMITLAEMCEAFKKAMDPYLQPIFVKLFKKAQDANSFIVQQVRKCTVSLCTYCSTSKICLIIVSNSNAKAVPVKLKVALCIDKILQKNSYSSQLLKQNPKIVGVMSNLIIDGSAQVRGMIKEIFIQVATNNQISQIQAIFKKGSSRDSWQKWNLIIDRQIQLQKRRKF